MSEKCVVYLVRLPMVLIGERAGLPFNRRESGTANGLSTHSKKARPMSADLIHAGLGLLFTSIWLMVGQILVSDR
jgi:hypothetical protein